MAKQAQANSRRLYWWDSHISSKNTRWLKENLTDMDAKVKSMIKLIEEDADSFARRAEMYYKKRPELMKMVEDFYRAYRALAERYDHATGALRQAHKTITEAFPNQVPDDELAPDDEYTDGKKGLKQFNDSFGSGDDKKLGGVKVKRGLIFYEDGEKEAQSAESTLKLEKEIKRLKEILAKFEAERESSVEKLSHQALEVSNIQDSETKRAEVEVESLKIALKKLENEKETSIVEYQKSILDLNERAQKAEAEAQSLKLDLATLKSEKATLIDQCKQSLEKISNLDNKLVLAEEEAKKLEEKAREAETEAETLKKALDELSVEKKANAVQKQQLLNTISTLEEKIYCAEEKGKKLKERAKEAETEAETLKKALNKVGVEKEANVVQNQQLLDTISTLEKKISSAEEEVQMLNGEIENGVEKLMGANEKCILLEKSNNSQNFELESLKLKISEQNGELAQKKGEIGILWSRFLEAETAFQTLQLLHAQTGEEMKSLAFELQSKSLIISDLETRNQSLLHESLIFKEEIKSLNELNLASSETITNMQNEIISLSEIKLKLEEEVELRVDERNALQQDIYCLKEELNDRNKKYLAMLDEVKDLQDENSNLKVIQEKEMRGKADLLEKLGNLEKVVEEKALLEKSLFDLSADLKEVREEKLALEECLKSVSEEKSTLLSEKDAIVTQLQVATENLEKISEKNTFMENSISDAHDEIEGLNIRLKRFEESCQVLENEKSDLTNEKVILVYQVDITREKLEDFEKKYRALEENYAVLEKLKESALCEVEELRLIVKERKFKEEKQMIELENLYGKVEGLNIRLKSFEESCQILENEKSDLTHEKFTLASQVEGLSIRLKSLEESCQVLENEKSDLTREKFTLASQVEGLSIRLKSLEESCQVLENEKSDLTYVKVALVSQVEITRERLEDFDKKYRALEKNNAVLEKQKESALCVVDELQSTVKESKFKEEKQMIEIENIRGEVLDLQNTRVILEEENLKLDHEKMSIVKDSLDLQEKYNSLEAENLLILGEAAFFSNLSLIFRNIIDEKSPEIEDLRSTVDKLHVLGVEFEEEITVLQGELEEAQLENMDLKTENMNLVHEKISKEKDFLELQERNNNLDAENILILGETAFFSNLSLIFKNIIDEKSREIEDLRSTVNKLQVLSVEFEDEISVLQGKLEEAQLENTKMKNTGATLEAENVKIVHEKISVVQDFMDLQEMNNSLEAENLLILGETAFFRNLSLIFKNIINEKYLEIEDLRSTVNKLQVICEEYKGKIGVLQGKLEEAQLENIDLNDTRATLQEENLKIVQGKAWLVKDFLDLQEMNNSLEADFFLILGETAFLNNLSLIFKNIINEKSLEIKDILSTVDKLQILSVDFEGEISVLKGKLEETQLENLAMKKLLMKAEISFSAITLANLRLNLEIESGKDLICQMETEISKAKCKVFDIENEKLELQNTLADQKEKNDEIKMLWEKEATNLTNEVHTLFVIQALLEEKFQKVIGVIKSLERETDSKDRVIELLEERITTLEGKNGEIVAQLDKYVLAINSLMDSISSLENTTHLHIQLQDGNHENLKVATKTHEDSNAFQNNMNTLSELSDLERRIIAVERTILETREIKELRSEGASNQENSIDFNSGEIVEKELGIDKLAIPKRFSIPNQEMDKTKILERLNSDSDKLNNLQTTVHDLKRKIEISDKRIKIKSFGENESLKGELAKAEDDIMQLSDLNGKLMENVDNFDDVKEEENRNLRKKFSEQARKVSERIGQLQLEVQKIQFSVLKMVGNGKNKTEFKSKRASLRNYLGLRSSDEKNKTKFCGCVRALSRNSP